MMSFYDFFDFRLTFKLGIRVVGRFDGILEVGGLVGCGPFRTITVCCTAGLVVAILGSDVVGGLGFAVVVVGLNVAGGFVG
jgi:hypothetical protein